jgi:hypothetical protein
MTATAAGVVVGLGRGGALVDNQTGQVVIPVGGTARTC